MNFGFDTPFAEQLEFFRQKLNLPTERWDDITRSAHDRAFVVAGAMKADLLTDFKAAIDKALASGGGLESFRRDFPEIVKKHGWTGWTGEGTAGGEAWRTKVIYQTNMLTSYAAGRYRQLTDPDMLAMRPYWRYKHADFVANPRLQHVAWDGLVLPHDHPFWQTHFPPNGWGCHCRVMSASRADYERAVKAGKHQPPEGWDAIDAKTGAPVGISKGFDYAPGASVTDELRQFANAKAKALPAPISQAFTNDVAAVISPPRSLDEFIGVGKTLRESMPDASNNPAAFYEAMLQSLRTVGISAPAKLESAGAGARTVLQASMRFPDTWTTKADELGKLNVRGESKARGWAWTAESGGRTRLPGFGVVNVAPGDGFIVVRPDDVSNAVHEFSHRLQAALPGLDEIFQALHRRRTDGEPLQQLAKISNSRYRPDELTREDHYVDPYWGKEYPGRGALEVMTMTFESLLGGDFGMLKRVYTNDREVIDLALGLLHYWKP